MCGFIVKQAFTEAHECLHYSVKMFHLWCSKRNMYHGVSCSADMMGGQTLESFYLVRP